MVLFIAKEITTSLLHTPLRRHRIGWSGKEIGIETAEERHPSSNFERLYLDSVIREMWK